MNTTIERREEAKKSFVRAVAPTYDMLVEGNISPQKFVHLINNTFSAFSDVLEANGLDDAHNYIPFVADYYGITVAAMCSKQRDETSSKARNMFFYIAKMYSKSSLTEIGNAVGGRDHTTVIHGANKISKSLDDIAVKKEVDDIVKAIVDGIRV